MRRGGHSGTGTGGLSGRSRAEPVEVVGEVAAVEVAAGAVVAGAADVVHAEATAWDAALPRPPAAPNGAPTVPRPRLSAVVLLDGRIVVDLGRAGPTSPTQVPSPTKISQIRAERTDARCFGGLGGLYLPEELDRGAVGIMAGCAARGFFARALWHGPVPVEVTTDGAPVYPRLVDEAAPAARHVTEQYANNTIEADHGRLKARLRPMRGVKRALRSQAW